MPVPEYHREPELQTLARALCRAGRPEVATQLEDAELGGATGSEILGRIGEVLREHARLRAALDAEGQRAWDALTDAVERAWPGFRLRSWFARLVTVLRPAPAAAPPVLHDDDPRPLAERFADAQTRAAFHEVRNGLGNGSLDFAAAKRRVRAIQPPVFDNTVSDGDKQLIDYEKRQLYAALDAAAHETPGASGRAAAETFERCLAVLNLR